MKKEVDITKLQPHDVLKVAIYSEQEAQEIYEEFAGLMRTFRNEKAAKVFEELLGVEREHERQLVRLYDSLFPAKESTVNPSQLMEAIERPDFSTLDYKMRVSECFHVALEAEKSALTYYTEAARVAEHADARYLLQHLAEQEASHIKYLLGAIKEISKEEDIDFEYFGFEDPTVAQ